MDEGKIDVGTVLVAGHQTPEGARCNSGVRRAPITGPS